MYTLFNKTTFEWKSADSIEGLSADWVVDPVFSNFQRANTLGPKYWTYSGNTINVLSDEEIDSNSTFLQEAKDVLKEKVNAYRDTYLFDYFVYDGKQWDCDQISRDNISGANLMSVLNGGVLPPMEWRDYNNTNHAVTATYMGNMAATLMTFTSGVYTASWQHKTAIDALTTITAVNAYDYQSTLWPSRSI